MIDFIYRIVFVIIGAIMYYISVSWCFGGNIPVEDNRIVSLIFGIGFTFSYY